MTEHFTPIRKMFCVNYYSIPNKCTYISRFSVIIVYFIVFFSEIILGLNNCNYNHVMEKPTINYYIYIYICMPVDPSLFFYEK